MGHGFYVSGNFHFFSLEIFRNQQGAAYPVRHHDWIDCFDDMLFCKSGNYFQKRHWTWLKDLLLNITDIQFYFIKFDNTKP